MSAVSAGAANRLLSPVDLFGVIDDYFLAPDKLRKVATFTKAQRQVEGWFKGELISLFDDLCESARVPAWEAERLFHTASRTKCDFVVDLPNERVWLEVKTLYHGAQRAAQIGLDIYLYKDGVGIWGDVSKLSNLVEGSGYNLLFIYPRPDAARWFTLLSRYKLKVAPIELIEVSRVSDFPPELYICKIHVRGGNVA